MNRHKAHRMFVISSIYLLGIIVIMGLFLVPHFKERFAQVPLLEEQYPMLVSNYTSYPHEGRTLWIEEPNKLIPVVAAEKYGTRYIYTGDLQEGSFEGYELGVYLSKKHYMVYKLLDGADKPELFGPFEK